jgi:hypothetical protein
MKFPQIVLGFVLAASVANGRPLGELRRLNDAEKAIIRSAAESRLKDPSSAQYQWFMYNGQSHYCARINAKNGYGGYIGFYEFQVDVQKDASGKIISASEPSYYGPDTSSLAVMKMVCAVSAKADTEDKQPALE